MTTRDEVLAMAEQAGFGSYEILLFQDGLERLVALAVAKEREDAELWRSFEILINHYGKDVVVNAKQLPGFKKQLLTIIDNARSAK